MSRSRRLWPLALMLLGIGGFVYAGWRVTTAPTYEDGYYEDEDEEPPPEDLDGGHFEEVRAHSVTETRAFRGTVLGEGLQQVRAPKGMTVPVVKIHHEMGEMVEKGDPLVTLDREQVEKAIEQARAEGREADAKRFEGYLEHVVIRAPIAGQVHDIHTEVGQIPFDVGIPLIVLADPSSYVFVALVPEDVAAAGANIGRDVTVRLSAGVGEVEGTVTALDATGERRIEVPGGFVAVVVGLPPTEGLEQDLAGELLLAASARQVGLVPEKAVTWREDVGVVRVWEDGEVLERTIEHGDRIGDDLVVLYGVFPGERVLVPDGD